MKNRTRKVRPKGFSLVEALVSIAIVVMTAASILSLFFYSAHLRALSERYTIGINACQKILEDIRYSYLHDTSTTARTWSDLTTGAYTPSILNKNKINGKYFYILTDGSVVESSPGISTSPQRNLDFFGRIYSTPITSPAYGTGMLVVISARMAFRVERRLVGGSQWPSGAWRLINTNTPCQVSTTIIREKHE